MQSLTLDSAGRSFTYVRNLKLINTFFFFLKHDISILKQIVWET